MKQLLTTDVARRRLGACLFLGIVLALITGSTGTANHPFHAARESLIAVRVIWFLLIGVALWVVWTLGTGPGASSVTRARRAVTNAVQPITRSKARYGGYVVLLAIAIFVPRTLPASSSYLQQALFSGAAIYALLGLGLNVVVGYAGLLDLGFIAFYAIGAYVTAYLVYTGKELHSGHTPIPWHAPFHLNGFFVLPIAAAAAALAGVILGGPTLRLRGDYLAIVTLGFGEIVQLLAINANGVTNGSQGAFGVPPLRIHLAGIHYTWSLDPLPEYYLLLGIIVVVMIAFSRLERSRTGRAWAAIREDEIAAAASGVPTTRYKLLAFAIGASTSGFAGVIFATYQFFNPQSFSFQASILVLTIVIFGGMGSIFGVVVGATLLQLLTAYLQHANVVPAEDSPIFFGAIVMAMMVFRPQGLIPSRRRSREIRLAEEGVGGADALGAAEGVS
ncbi:MAG TPA: branched-chain amino acid ABC transporter permease [Mycobacteriales bacterium]|nr:branched-chain amino acid ABC transporter permease [Mycobacteriales bacterium]